MANVVVTSTANIIKVDFGIYAGTFTPYQKAIFHKNVISFQTPAAGGFVRVEDRQGQNWAVSFDGAGESLQVDSVDGVVPTDNDDLYNLLIGLLN